MLEQPNTHEFYIGDLGVDGSDVIGYVRVRRSGVRQFIVRNHGTRAFTLLIKSSKNNATENYPTGADAADAYAAMNVRVNGASASSIVVQPGGFRVFTNETTGEGSGESFIRFEVTDATSGTVVGSKGVLRVESMYREDVFYNTDPGAPVAA